MIGYIYDGMPSTYITFSFLDMDGLERCSMDTILSNSKILLLASLECALARIFSRCKICTS